MTSQVGEAIVELRADVDRLRSDITSAGDGAGKGFAGRFGKAIAGLGALAAGAAVTGFLKASVGEAREAQKIGAATQQIIKATGGAANVTSGQVSALAGSISRAAGVDDELVQQGENLILTFKNVRNEAGRNNDIFNRATEAAVDLSAAGFGSVTSASMQLGKALNDPIKGMSALSRSGVTFTQAQKDQVAALVESGNVLGAQKIILAEVEGQVGGVAAATATAGEKATVAWGNVKESVGTLLLPALDAVANIFSGSIAPAIEGFVSQVQAGTGAGGDFREVATGIGDAVRGFVADFQAGAGVAGALRIALTGIGGAVASFVADFVAGQGAAGVLRAVLAALASTAATVVTAIAGNRAVLTGLAVAVTGAVVAWKAFQAAQALSLLWLKLHTVGTIQHTIVSRAAAVAARVWAAGQWLLNAAMTANPIGLVVAAIVGLVAAFIFAWKNSETFRRIITNTFNAVRGVVASVIGWIRNFITSAWAFIVNAVRAYVNAYRAVIVTAMSVVRGVVIGVMTVIRNFVSAAWRAISTAVKVAVAVVRSVVTSGFNAVRAAISAAMNAAKAVAALAWRVIQQGASNAVNNIVGTLRGLAGKIAGFAGAMLSAGSRVGSSIIQGIMSGLRSAGGFVGDLVSSIRSAINGALNLPFTIHGPGPLPDFSIPAFAAGTLSAPGGVATVGEHGRELVYLPRGARVLGNAASEQRINRNGGGATLTQNIYLPTGDPEAVAAAVASRWVLAGIGG